MALIKPFETPQKVTASYHKLLKAEFHIPSQTIELVFAVFYSAEARDNGGSVLWHEYLKVPFSALQEDPRVGLYQLAESYEKGYLAGAWADAPQAPSGPLLIAPERTPE